MGGMAGGLLGGMGGGMKQDSSPQPQGPSPADMLISKLQSQQPQQQQSADLLDAIMSLLGGKGGF